MPKINDVKTFAGAKMNRGTHKSLLKNNEFSEIRNLRTNTSEEDNVGIGERILGNTLINNPDIPFGEYKMHGSAVDGENHAIFFMILDKYKDKNHGIYRYNTDTQVIEAVVIDPLLNFQEGYRITHADVIGDILYCTDNYEDPDEPFLSGNQNQPRKINWRKAINSRAKAYFGSVQVWDAGVAYLFENYVIWEGKIYQASRDVLTGTTPANTYYWTLIETYDINNNYLNLTREILNRAKRPPTLPPTFPDGNITVNGNNWLVENGFYGDDTVNDNKLRGESFQFAYRWKYDDNEFSTWSPTSKSAFSMKGIRADGTYNEGMIDDNVVVMSLEMGEFEVKRIEIAVRSGNSGNWRLVDRIYKYDEDGTVDTAYKSNTTFYYPFFNNKIGEALDQKDFNRPFDYIPQICEAQKLAEKNKLIDGNYIEGYDNVDLDVDMGYNVAHISASELETVLTSQDPQSFLAGVGYVWIDAAVEESVYVCNFNYGTVIGQTLFFPSTGAVYYTATEDDTPLTIAQALAQKVDSQYPFTDWQCEAEYPNVIAFRNLPGSNVKNFVNVSGHYIQSMLSKTTTKSGFWNEYGLAYYDAEGKHGAVNTSDNTNIYIPFLTEMVANGTIPSDQELFHRIITNYTISHIPPKWAESYQWVKAKPSDYYLQYSVNSARIARVETGQNNYIKIAFNEDITLAQDAFPHLSIKTYSFVKGDRIRPIAYKYKDGNDYIYKYFDRYIVREILSVEYPPKKGEDGAVKPYGLYLDQADEYVVDDRGNKVLNTRYQYLIIEDFDIETYMPIGSGIQDTSTMEYEMIFEVFREGRQVSDDDTKLFYEIGERFDILNPHTDVRAHDAGVNGVRQIVSGGVVTQNATGNFERGGAYINGRISVTTVFACESMDYSDFWESEITDMGRASIVDRNAMRQRYDSNLRFGGLYLEDTQINNLSTFKYDDYKTLSGKHGAITTIDEMGHTLKVRQVLKSTSLYVGREGLTQPSEDSGEVLTTKKQTLGSAMPSRSKYGCSDASAYVSNGTYAYFIDIINGVAVRDAANGMTPISQYGMEDWFKDKCKYLLEDCTSYKIFAGYDGYNNEVYFTFIGYLDDGTHTIDTVVFNETVNGWVMFVDLGADNDTVGPMDGFSYFGNVFVSYLNGALYLHNTNALTANFYGVQYNPALEFYANTGYNFVKNFKSVSIDANNVWYAPDAGNISIEATSTYPRGMISLLKSGIFVDKEGVFYAPFGKNMVSNQADATLEDYVNGQDLRGHALKIRLINTDVSGSEISGINIKSSVSRKSGIIK